MSVAHHLREFARQNGFRGKGPLCVALVVTEHARQRGLPLPSAELKTEKGGQVLGLGQPLVQSILKRYGIEQILAEEGGRTSRGSLHNMVVYVDLLNQIYDEPDFVIDAVEEFWIERVREHMAAQPFVLRLDASLGFRAIVRNLVRQVEERQGKGPGAQIVGTVMQHLVGAKLNLVLGDDSVKHHSANQNDQGAGRGGDFDVHDVSIHVTAHPSDSLIRKCKANLDGGRKSIIVTSTRGVIVAEELAAQQQIADRIDILDFEQFLASNVYELSRFAPDARRLSINDLLEHYNEIIETHETDKSLKIELA
jgi:hypothetical protein